MINGTKTVVCKISPGHNKDKNWAQKPGLRAAAQIYVDLLFDAVFY